MVCVCVNVLVGRFSPAPVEVPRGREGGGPLLRCCDGRNGTGRNDRLRLRAETVGRMEEGAGGEVGGAVVVGG